MKKKSSKLGNSKIEKNATNKLHKKSINDENKKTFYQRNYKKLIIIPVLLFLLSAFVIGSTIVKEKSPIYRDISLKGGLSAVVEVDNLNITPNELRTALEQKYPDNTFAISILDEGGDDRGFIIDIDLTTDDEEQFIANLSEIFGFDISDNYTSNFISPTLSDSFFREAGFAIIFSFIFMSVVIFLYFKKVVPSAAVVLSAIFDIVVTVGVLDFFEYKISIAGIGAIVMLIGYSIDTDILLTNRLIKEKNGESYFVKTFSAFKTGTLMSFTTLSAGAVALFVTNSNVIFEIALIMVVGLLVDYISTWVQNTGILLWWLQHEERKSKN